MIPGNAADSLLIQAVCQQHESLAMPPKQKLKAEQIDALVEWVNSGAVWPAPVQVLLEDDPAMVEVLGQGDGQIQLITTDHASGQAAAEVKGARAVQPRVPGWEFAIREQPGRSEYRYLRFAWKKLGGGSAMLEVANAGQWPARESPAGRYVAGIDRRAWLPRRSAPWNRNNGRSRPLTCGPAWATSR